MAQGAGAVSPPHVPVGDDVLSAGKPWTQTLARTLRDNTEHVHRLVHDTAAGHDHDGVNSKLVAAGASFRFPLDVVTILSGSSAAAWTAHSLAAATGSDTARVALLGCRVSAGGVDDAWLRLRKTGTSPGDPLELHVSGTQILERLVVLPLDGSERLDYSFTWGGSGGPSWHIRLEGWIV